MYWLEISVTTDGEAAEAVSELLRPFAYDEGVVFEQLGDVHSPDPSALEPEVTVKIYVPEEEDSPLLRRKLTEAIYHMNRLYPIAEPQFRELEEKDWANAWRENYHPFRIGRRLWIQPTWQIADEITAEDIVVSLDPGMAFGTGLHPTTQMVLQALEDYVCPGFKVLDVGTGSGILSIAAAKLGAMKIIAFDTDRMAIRAAKENAIQNYVDKKMSLYLGDITALATSSWDLILINILAPVIISLLKDANILNYIHQEGRVILSGIIEDQVEDVRRAVRYAGGIVINKFSIRDWICLVVEKEKAP